MNSDLNVLRAVLAMDGIDGGIRILNARVPHRFTSIYRLLNKELQRVHFVDKTPELPGPDLALIPFRDSFCHLALPSGEFTTVDAPLDARLDGNPYQHIIISYVGLPILGRTGDLWGTFCHTDVVPQTIESGESEFLIQAVRLLPSYLNLN